eukprot:2790879-Prorocentrum_lima.AAC.1
MGGEPGGTPFLASSPCTPAGAASARLHDFKSKALAYSKQVLLIGNRQVGMKWDGVEPQAS